MARCAPALMIVLVAGCSSSPRPVGSSHPPGWRPPPPAPPAAVALVHRLLDDAVLPPGTTPYRGPVSRWLASDPAGTPGLVNVVQTHRFWTTRSTTASVAGFLKQYRPRGFTGYGSGSVGALRSRTDRALYVTDDLAVLPSDISNAQLDIAVADAGSGNVVIRVDTWVAWTQPRPRAEYAPARDRVVILSVTHVDGPKPRPGKRVVATTASLVEPVVRSFNQLRIFPPAYSYECPPGQRLSYEIAFAPSPNATPDVVATTGGCGGVGARVGKRTLPTLVPTGAFSESVAHLLGSSDLHW